MVDVDHFKSVNDNHGHSTGDEVLRRVAETIQQTARASDVVCRYGGEEFCMLLPQTDTHQAVVAAERVRKAVEELKFNGLAVTASLGVSSLSLGRSRIPKSFSIRRTSASILRSELAEIKWFAGTKYPEIWYRKSPMNGAMTARAATMALTHRFRIRPSHRCFQPSLIAMRIRRHTARASPNYVSRRPPACFRSKRPMCWNWLRSCTTLARSVFRMRFYSSPAR